jgi:hypothetical protein
MFEHVKKYAVVPGVAESFTCIIDCDGVGALSAPKDKMQTMIGVLQKHFPGRLYKLFAINVGFFSRAVAKIILAFADPFTKQKISILSDDYKSEVSDVISYNQLESKFGGYYSRTQSAYFPPEFSTS